MARASVAESAAVARSPRYMARSGHSRGNRIATRACLVARAGVMATISVAPEYRVRCRQASATHA